MKISTVLFFSISFCVSQAFAESLLVPNCVLSSECQRVPALKGWDYLATLLLQDGEPQAEVFSVLTDRRLPKFSPVTFRLAPRESSNIYRGFLSDKKIETARAFLRRFASTFQDVEHTFGVSRCVIASILLIETGYGANTGRDRVFYRLARVASVRDPDNLLYNIEILTKEDGTVQSVDVRARAEYLEKTFYPEIRALLEIERTKNVDIHRVFGSRAGAFGWPQFLPSNYLRFGIDWSKSGDVSLFDPQDAIASVANFLKNFGWNDSLSYEAKREIIWRYNRSAPYIDTVLQVSSDIGMCPNNSLIPRSAQEIRSSPGKSDEESFRAVQLSGAE